MKERKTKRKFSPEFKNQIVEAYINGTSWTEIIKAQKISNSVLHSWIQQYKNPQPIKKTGKKEKNIGTSIEGTLIKKKKGKIVKTSLRVAHISSKPYLVDKEKCFTTILSYQSSPKISTTEIIKIKAIIKYILSNSTININKLYQSLKIITEKEQLDNLFDLLLSNCPSKDNRETLEQNKDIALSIAIKQIIILYYLEKLSKLSKETIESLEQEISQETNLEVLLNSINEEFPEESNNNGIKSLSEKIFLDALNNTYDKTQTHLCWEHCQNGYPNCCKKIQHHIKQSIEKYDFITDGYQVQDKNKQILYFKVTGCNHYQKELKR